MTSEERLTDIVQEIHLQRMTTTAIALRHAAGLHLMFYVHFYLLHLSALFLALVRGSRT